MDAGYEAIPVGAGFLGVQPLPPPGAPPDPRHSLSGSGSATVLLVPRARVGRVIGRGGDTIKALQAYSGATIQIDQSADPTRVVLAGGDGAVRLAASMVGVRGWVG